MAKRTNKIRDLIPWYTGVAPGKLGSRNLLALQFYIDDSGKNDPPVFVLAGFVASVERWLEFSAAWSSALEESPSIAHFKMVEANRRKGEFAGISKNDRDKKLRRLAEIVRDHVEFGISIAIPHADYKRVFENQLMKSYDTPYVLAHNLMMNRVDKVLNEIGNADEVDVIFDRQLDREQIITRSYALLEKQPNYPGRKRFPTSPVFADDKRALPLQAADMLAWHIRRSYRDGIDRLRGLSTAGQVIADEILAVNELWVENDLREMFDMAQGVARGLNTMFPYQAEALSKEFDRLATLANIELMESAVPFNPVELISFPANGMGRFRFVRNCEHSDNPHLHRKRGNVCLAEQTEVEWGSASHS
ncbi:MAG: DUF3800 domain-containing protein [Erythrobacter sp.]|nr:DUF3800 domain-containing protein [Erythrobacter sp.]